MCWSTVIAFSREKRAYEKAERAVLFERIGDYYGLEVDGPLERAPKTGPIALLRRRLRPPVAAAPEAASPSSPIPSVVDPDVVPSAAASDTEEPRS